MLKAVLPVVAVALSIAVPAAHGAAECPKLLDRTLPDLVDRPSSLCAHRGKVILAVNTASQCGYTPQYEGLEKLYRRYKDRGFVVLGFPSNDFGGQEPGSNQQIAEFCRVNYGVSFPVFAKSHVAKAAPNASKGMPNAFFADLASRTKSAPRWNFHKYLIDRDGEKVVAFDTAVEPLDPKLVGAIERLLEGR